MKIVVTGTRGFPGVQGGVEKHCEKLYAQLAEKGCDITVFTRKPYVDQTIDKYKDVKLVPLNCTKNKFLEAIFHTLAGVIKARSLQLDILHIHAIGPSLFAPLARILGMKVVVTHHGPDYNRAKWPLPARIFLKLCERAGMMFANEVIAVAQYIVADIKRKFQRDVVYIPNGVDVPQLAFTDQSLKKYGLRKGVYILAVGRYVPEKGFHDLIEAFNMLKKDKRDNGVNIRSWKLVIVGDADHEDNYSKTLRSMAGKNSSIVLTGFLSGQSLCEIFSYAGIFVLPSYHEGLPIVLLEAMSYGLSCIASDIEANKNVELDKNRYFKSGDIEMLSLKINQFVRSSWSYKDRDRQIELISDKYNWEKIADDTLNIYRRIYSHSNYENYSGC